MRRNLVFNGWASMDLLEFLASIGKETVEKLSEQEVVAIVAKYCADHRLGDPENENKILCDAKLRALFRRKWISKNGIQTHVAGHLAENRLIAAAYADVVDVMERGGGQVDQGLEVGEGSGGNGVVDVMEIGGGQVDQGLEVGEGSGGDGVVLSAGEKRKRDALTPEADLKKKGKGVLVEPKPKGLFAAVIDKNIKHVYLRRKVLDELMMEPAEIFDAKVVGCFVRIKTDPCDHSRTTSHMLVLVTGVKRSPGNAEMGDSVLLEVSCVTKDVPVSEVSDDYFTEDECEDLHQRVKDGLLKRPLVADFQEKAQSVRAVIIRDWVPRKLAALKRRITQGTDNGSKKEELIGYLESFNKLSVPAVQSRLVRKFPKIIADEEEVEPAGQETPRHEEEVVILQPEEVLMLAKPSKYLIGAGTRTPGNEMEGNVTKAAGTSRPPAPTASFSPDHNVGKTGQKEIPKKVAKTTARGTPAAARFVLEKNRREKDAPNMASKTHEGTSKEVSQKTKKVQIIDLTDDDDDDQGDQTRPAPISNRAAAAKAKATVAGTENANINMWRCMSVKGRLLLGGLYSISLLKKWRDMSTDPSALHFKVWKLGQREDQAIPLDVAIYQAYGSK